LQGDETDGVERLPFVDLSVEEFHATVGSAER
jgi:hypothetical protein